MSAISDAYLDYKLNRNKYWVQFFSSLNLERRDKVLNPSSQHKVLLDKKPKTVQLTGAPMTNKQKVLIVKLHKELGLKLPAAKTLNRGSAGSLIAQLISAKKNTVFEKRPRRK